MTYTLGGHTFDYSSETRYSPVYEQTVRQLTLAIPGGGCQFWIKTRGKGCTFCGFPGLTRHLNLGEGHEDFFGGWQLSTDILLRMYQTALDSDASCNKLAIFNGGSFFVDSEVAPNFRQYVYKDVAQRSNIKLLMVESRPEYIKPSHLDEALPVLEAGKDFMVGIGVESADDRVRNKLLAKGMHKKDIESAIRLLQSRGAKVFAYAFLKAPGLSEKEARIDAINTLNYLTNIGVDEIALSCAFVPPNTPLEQRFLAGEFRPPWLWTILEVLEKAGKFHWPLSVGGFNDNPKPVAIAQNCGACNERIMSVIDRFREVGKFSKPQHCSCYTTWETNVNTWPV